MATQRIPYVVHGGEQTLCPPFFVSGVDTHSFVLQADASRMRALCDRCLNEPLRVLTNGAPPFEYRPISSFVMLTFSHLSQTHAVSPPQAWVEEHEAILWMLTMAGHEKLGVFVVDHLAWFTPYVFVDSPWAMITGQMVYGFQKEIAAVVLEDGTDGAFTVDTTVVKEFGPDSQAASGRLLTVRPVESRPGTFPELHTLADLVTHAMHALPAEHHSLVLPDLHFLADTTSLLVHGRMPLVLLKQVRDAADGTAACYQAVIEMDLTMQHLQDPRLSLDAWEVRIEQYASHPIVEEFGFTGPVVPSILAASMRYDLTFGIARIIAASA